MRNPSETFARFFLVVALILSSASSLCAQSPNRIWFVTYNGDGSDVSVRNLVTDGSASFIATGSASNFVSQTNFLSFRSPYDIAVDPAMGKVYVVDNNLNAVNGQPEYIYSFDLTGTPAQIAASAQIIYTMPVTLADTITNRYPLLSGLALDPVNHFLYFNQIDTVSTTNSYIGRLSLDTSSKSDLFSAGSGNPTLQTFYVAQIPGQGPLAIDKTNFYIGAINGLNGNSGVYVAPISGSGSFSEIITNSFNDPTFTNGFVSGVASDSKDNLVYYLTLNGAPYSSADTNLNALWIYNVTNHAKIKIASGFQGYPDNIALDFTNNRYYFTTGRDGTANPSPANYQAIYTGILGSTNAPTLLYTPALTSLDTVAYPGRVAIGGLYIVDMPSSNHPPVATPMTVTRYAGVTTLKIALSDLATNWSDPDSDTVSFASAGISTNGITISTNSGYVFYINTNYVADQFSYLVSDVHGATANGVVNIVVSTNFVGGHISTVNVSGNVTTVNFSGIPNYSYSVERSTNLVDWNAIWTTNAPGNGAFQFNDANGPEPMAFYRIRWNP